MIPCARSCYLMNILRLETNVFIRHRSLTNTISRPYRDIHTPIRALSTQNTHNQPSPTRPPRFYVLESLANSSAGKIIRLSDEESRHATKSLRLKEGSSLELCDGKGTIALAEIASIDSRKGSTIVRLAHDAQTLSLHQDGSWSWTVAVACGSLKGGRADWLIEKCVELGAMKFQPLLTERSPVIGSSGDGGGSSNNNTQYKKKKSRKSNDENDSDDGDYSNGALSGRESRWHRVATAAMKQCLRAHGMIISPPCTIDELCSTYIQNSTLALVGAEGSPPIHTVVLENSKDGSSNSSSTKSGVLILGPEGDFTIDELNTMVDAGARRVGLGSLRLRTETAAISALAYVNLASIRHACGVC